MGCHLPKFNATTAPSHPAAGFPTTCQTCHTTAGWKPSSFSHTGFALTGKHTTVGCASCHVAGKYQGTARDCVGCHLPKFNATTAPSHPASGFPTTCQTCHTTAGWKPSSFSHTSFALTGKHTTVGCAGCHVAGKYQGTARDCVGCHLPKFNATTAPSHPAAGFPTTCQTCHTTAGWKPAQFTHTFQIYSGKHSGKWSKCGDCHTNASNFKVFSCAQCHSKSKIDGEHKSIKGYVYDFPTCLNCHPTGRKP